MGLCLQMPKFPIQDKAPFCLTQIQVWQCKHMDRAQLVWNLFPVEVLGNLQYKKASPLLIAYVEASIWLLFLSHTLTILTPLTPRVLQIYSVSPRNKKKFPISCTSYIFSTSQCPNQDHHTSYQTQNKIRSYFTFWLRGPRKIQNTYLLLWCRAEVHTIQQVKTQASSFAGVVQTKNHKPHVA